MNVQELVDTLLTHLKVSYGEVDVHFVDKKTIAKLHQDFFDDPTPTDCITFPYEDDPLVGEIFVCPEVAEEYAKTHGKDFDEELTLYVVHGLLHLLGYDDIDPKDRTRMRSKERTCMTFLKKKNCIIRYKSTNDS